MTHNLNSLKITYMSLKTRMSTEIVIFLQGFIIHFLGWPSFMFMNNPIGKVKYNANINVRK